MKVIKTISQMQLESEGIKHNNKTIAVVPTMGYLHDGHLSLIKKAKQTADYVITTIFVNPTQFGPNEDFSKYPRDFDRDYLLAESAGSDYIFFPDSKEMYPLPFFTSIIVSNVSEKFEGIFRPSHFQGVATVVVKLFNITKPNIAVFGQKDYQQTMVIRSLIRDLNFEIELIVVPTLRESDGLAMSSRNKYLSESERKKAGILFKAMEDVKTAIAKGECDRKMLNSYMHKKLREIKEIKIDYAACATSNSLEEPEFFLPGEEIVILIACFLGKTRLIDNSLMKIPGKLNQSNFVEGI